MQRIGILLALGCSLIFGQTRLNVGFDIDDTVLYSRFVFENAPRDAAGKLDYAWINQQDRELSPVIPPTVSLINYFRSHDHAIYFITGRNPEKGAALARYLTDVLGFPIEVNRNLFFAPRAVVDGTEIRGKTSIMGALKLDLYYGDADTDILAALKARVQPVRVARHSSSIAQYGQNYFGNTLKGDEAAAPWNQQDLERFLSASVGPFGEPIYPLIWEGPSR
ncbi:MAG: HAD family acid phosphatase [Fidelibacterota bacterium]